MVWRFYDQPMDFDRGEIFVFNRRLGREFVNNRSPIGPLPDHLLHLGRVSHIWDRGDRCRSHRPLPGSGCRVSEPVVSVFIKFAAELNIRIVVRK
ncbi:hypothetical protein Hanom_Chr06g00555381 [Helianthus anomalus]